MTTDFENDLREALQREAARAPELPNGWQPEQPLDAPSTHRSSRILLIAACLIILAGGAGLLMTQSESNPQDVFISNTTGNSSNGPDVAPAAPTTQLITVPSVPDDVAPTTGLEPTVPIAGGAVIQRLAIGDMLMLGAADELAAAGFTVDAVASRQFADVVDVLDALRAEGRLGEVVVISLGENGSIGQSAVDRAMSELADVDNVIILTNAADRPWTAANNSLIDELAATHPNVKLLDWMGLNENCSGECFYEDGVHLRPDGAEFYADLITYRVNELTGMTSASQPMPPADTIFPPPVVVDDPQMLTQSEADAISNDAGDRRTVAIERAADGTVLWWMTVWTGTTPSGVEVFCTATRAAGHSCVPDHNAVLSHPVQVSSFSMHAPSALTLLANDDVTSLRAAIDDAEPVEIQLVDIGVSSGKQAAGLYLGDSTATKVRFDATLTDGSNYSFVITAPDVAPSPNSTPAVPSPPEPYAPLELFGD